MVESNFTLKEGQEDNWSIIIDQGYNADRLSKLNNLLKDKNELISKVKADLENGETTFKKLVGSADGFQLTADKHSCVRHFSNTLFNIMRGGVFYENYSISKEGFLNHVENFSKKVFR